MLQKLKGRITIQKLVSLVPSGIFLLFVSYMMIHTYSETVKDTLKEAELSFDGFTALSDTLEDILQENFYDKNSYINLNGLATRMLGINSLNGVHKLKNGYLTGWGYATDVSSSAENVVELNQFLNDREIAFVYVLAPAAISMYDTEFAPGYDSNAYLEIDYMISELTEGGGEDDRYGCMVSGKWMEYGGCIL